MSSFIAGNGLGVVLLTLATTRLAGGDTGPTGESVTYDLRAGSYLLDDCPICDHLSRPIPLEGTLAAAELLVPGAGVRVFQINDIDLHTSGGEYSVKGTGSYEFGVLDPDPTQALTLDADINGETGIKLQGVDLPIEDPWPFLDITVDEVTSSVSRVYHLRLVAAPKAQGVLYELGKGSTFNDCLPCAALKAPAPVTGTFLLTPVDASTLFTTYRLDAIDFRDAAGDLKIQITGIGKYRQGGEVAITQEMVLDVLVALPGGQRQSTLDSGAVPVIAGFPALDVSPQDDLYALHIVASPSAQAAPFRRGDANGDGGIDLGDAVRVLFNLFAAEPIPCPKAADPNDDGAVDLSDVMDLLNYLFLGGPAPREPLASCGVDPTPDGLTCQSFAGCR
jgi:hypothetical protein